MKTYIPLLSGLLALATPALAVAADDIDQRTLESRADAARAARAGTYPQKTSCRLTTRVEAMTSSA
jgi:hypothetical protein